MMFGIRWGSTITVLLLLASAAMPRPLSDTVIADFESGRFGDWEMSGNCWGQGPENSRFAGRTLSGWQGNFFLSSAHPKAVGWDANSGTGRALSPTFRITGDTIHFLIGGGRQFGRCGIRLLVDGQEAFSETGDSPFQMRSVTWDVGSYRDKVGQIEVFDNAATGTYAYVHVDDIVMSSTVTEAPEPTVAPTPSPTTTDTPPSVPTRIAINRPVRREPKSPPPRRTPAPGETFPTRFGPPPPIAPYTTDILPTEKVVIPMIFPLLGNIPWHDNYNDDRGPHRHTGIDIPTPKMHPIVAPFSGTLGFKVYTFWIYGDNGYRCLGTHLNDDTPGTNDNTAQRDFMVAPNLRPGDHVVAGQFIGYVGNSGDATGPHLHFEIFAPEGIRNPAPSLRTAQHISEPRLGLSPIPPAPALGEVCIVGCVRGFDANRRILTVQLAARQKLPGKLAPVTVPKRYYMKLTPEMVTTLGGTEGIAAFPRDRALTFYGVETKANIGAEARRLILPTPEPTD